MATVKFAGHTMGMPKLDIFASIDLMRTLGFDGIEVRIKDDGQIDPDNFTEPLAERIEAKLAKTGIELACVTPYYRDFIDDAKRDSEIAGMRRAIDIAARLNCPIVRSYGGTDRYENVNDTEAWNRIVRGIQQCADYAADAGVNIAIETHIGSLTMSATDTVRMVEQIDRPNVGILFDFAWVDWARQETPEQAVRLIAPHLMHCHVKDWTIQSIADTKKTSTLLGDGDLPWLDVFKAIAATDYDGYFCDEYEKYWYDHLPEPQVGMKHNLDAMRRLWDAASLDQ